MDDAIICHVDFQQHHEFLRHIFNKLRQALNPKKSLFARKSLVFLGYLFLPDDIKVDPTRFEKIQNIQPAKNVKQVKMIIGFCQ